MENKPKLGYDSLLSSPHQIREKKTHHLYALTMYYIFNLVLAKLSPKKRCNKHPKPLTQPALTTWFWQY
jgi:hypothetical protein